MRRIDFSRLRSLTARQIVEAQRRDGFDLERQRGSHRQYCHRDGRRVTVSFHRPGATFPVSRLRFMLQEQARWTQDDLRRLGLE